MKNFLSIVTIILTVFVMSFSSAYAKDVKFAQVTDVYYKNKSDELIKIIKDINKTSDIDFVVFSGNNIAQANEKNLECFLRDLKKLNKPYYIIIGNKDVSKVNKLEKKTYFKIVRKYNHLHPKTPNYVFKKNDIVFIVVDGAKEVITGTNGAYIQSTLDWLDSQLTKYAYNKVVILQHFPVANKPPNEFYYTYNSLEYLQMLSKHNNVIAVVSGHYKKNDEIMYNGIYHITTPPATNGVYKIIDIDTTNNYQVFTILREVK